MNITTIGRGDQSTLLQGVPYAVRASDLPQLNPFALSDGAGHKFPLDARAGYRADAFKAPVMSSASGANFLDLMHDPRFNRHATVSAYSEIDPQMGMPKILSFPIHDKPRSILFTPDDRSAHSQWSRLPGFDTLPEGFVGESTFSIPIHEYDWRDLVLYKQYVPGDCIDVEGFKVCLSGRSFKNPKTGEVIEKDRSINSGSGAHGGSYWKLYDKSGDKAKRIGTLTKEGRFIRK